MAQRPWISVMESPAYSARADKLLSPEEQDEVIRTIARNPECGEVMTGTHGVRKLRVALEGRGKSGGARMIYFYYDEDEPVLMLGIFAKNEQANLSKAQRNALGNAILELKKNIRQSRERRRS